MAAFPNGYALLIAVDESTVKEWALPDVAKDVAALESVLTDSDRCGYQTPNVKVLKGAAATYQGIVDALEWLQQRIGADALDNATAFLYYSGHGWRDASKNPPEYFLIPFNANGDNLRSTALPAKTFADSVARLQPKRLFVALDCCHAGGIDAKEFGSAPGFTSAAVPPDVLMAGTYGVGPSGGAKGLQTLSVGAGRAVLSSSQGTQLSYIRKDRKMSIFTYHLYEALTGHAGASDAREVLVSDVMSHVWRRVPESAKHDYGEQQDPDYQVSGNFPLALLLGGKGVPKGVPLPEPIEDVRSRSISIQAGGDVITVGNISGSTGIAIGGNAQAIVNAPPPADLFAPLEAAIQRSSARRDEALQLARQIQQEIAGGNSDDGRLARMIDKLAALAPDTVGELTALFATPALSRYAGSATLFVLEKLRDGHS